MTIRNNFFIENRNLGTGDSSVSSVVFDDDEPASVEAGDADTPLAANISTPACPDENVARVHAARQDHECSHRRTGTRTFMAHRHRTHSWQGLSWHIPDCVL